MPSAPTLTLGTSTFQWGTQSYLMGIVNVTPDSFSGDGLLADNWVEQAVAHGVAQAAAGAHILDVGGESTRPGGVPVPLAEELRRVIPVIQALAQTVTVPISIDTYKAEVARQALAAGAVMVNDVWGLQRDAAMAQVVAEHQAAVVLMHNRSRDNQAAAAANLGGRYVGVVYADLLQDIARELGDALLLAQRAGIASERILLDPGIGFGKTVAQNLELIDRLRELTVLGYPLLVGPSRKSFVGYTLNLPPTERLEGTAAAVTLCIERGADVVRVHDVAAMRRVVALTDAVVRRPR